MAYGVRKVNEFIIRDGRALILTQNIATGSSQEQWDSLADGTIYLNPETGNLQYKKKDNPIKTWSRLLPENIFDEKSIHGVLLADNTITTSKYGKLSINQDALQKDCIDSSNIMEGGLTNKNFLQNSISGNKLEEASVNGAKVINNTLDGIKICDSSLDANIKIKRNSITSRCYGLESIINEALAKKSIKGENIADNTIVNENYGKNSIDDSILKDSTLTNRVLAENCIEEKNIQRSSISNLLIKDKAVNTPKIDDNAITSIKISEQAVGSRAIADEAIKTKHIKKREVTAECLEESVQETLREAIVLKDGKARIAGTLQVDKDIVSSSDKVYSITGFKVYNPIFADFAEGFVAAEPLEAGDIVEIDKHTCVRKASRFSKRIIGVVSEEYGICLGASEKEIESGAKVAIGMLGKIHITIIGKVDAGDFIVSCGDGIGYATKKYVSGAIVGKALEDKNNFKIGKVLCLVNIA